MSADDEAQRDYEEMLTADPKPYVDELLRLRAENASLRSADDYNPFNPDDPRNHPGGDDLPLVNAYLKIPEYDRHRRALAYDGLVAEVGRLSRENKTVIAQLDRNAVAHIASQRSLCDQRNELKAEVERLRRELDAANGGYDLSESARAPRWERVGPRG